MSVLSTGSALSSKPLQRIDPYERLSSPAWAKTMSHVRLAPVSTSIRSLLSPPGPRKVTSAWMNPMESEAAIRFSASKEFSPSCTLPRVRLGSPCGKGLNPLAEYEIAGRRMDAKAALETITLAGGCFWCLQPLFKDLKGVEDVVVGYSGGYVKNPSYEMVCTDVTGHAEVVQVAFDPKVIPLEDLLRIFFSVHDPTTLNRQGHDAGTQYRSAIFYHTPEQKATAERVVRDLSAAKLWDDPIVTEVAPFTAFYRGEEYHQDYFEKSPWAGYCRTVVAPKVAKFRKEFAARLKK